MKNLTEYFNQKNCPAVDNLSVAEVKKICIHIQTLINFAGKDILSLGCGDGRIEEILFSEVKPKNLTLLDISERNLKMAQEKIPYAKLIQADLRNSSLHELESYNLIYAASVAQYFTSDEIQKLNLILFNHLKSNGNIFYFNVPDSRRRFLY